MNTEMPIIHSHAAGIDVGSKQHYVSVGQSKEQVRSFGVYTQDYLDLISWLKSKQITSVAMESTGTYWQTLFMALQSAGFEVVLVNGAHIKHVKGKKTDVLDCMWIQKLHSIGLLSGSFLPNESTRALRNYHQHRESLVEQLAKYSLKMQKNLRLMNLRLDIAISDITGKTGMAIIGAILNGERDGKRLAQLADPRIKKSKAELAAALQGDWKIDLLFLLQECHSMYLYHKTKLVELDKQISLFFEQELAGQATDQLAENVQKKKKTKNSPAFQLQVIAYQLLGVDLYQIQGVSDATVLTLLSSLGDGIGKFTSAKQFVSWLRLAPNNKVSGGKLLSSRTPKSKHRLGQALRKAANAIGNSKQSSLKPFFSKIAFKKGRGAAITATARKLAVIIYHMLTKKEAFDPHKTQIEQQFQRNRKIAKLKKMVNTIDLSQIEMDFVFTRK